MSDVMIFLIIRLVKDNFGLEERILIKFES